MATFDSSYDALAAAGGVTWQAMTAAGIPFVLLTRLTFQTKPTFAYGAYVGIGSVTDSISIAAGSRNRTATGQVRPLMLRWAGQTEGADNGAAALQTAGALVSGGLADGVAGSTFSGGVACFNSVTGNVQNWSTVNTGNNPFPFANLDTFLVITHNSSVLETETLSLKAEYAYVSFDGYLS